MIDGAFPSRMRRLKKKQFIVLNDPEKVWHVVSGSLELISARFRDGNPSGGHRHLFHMAAGNTVFGSEPGGSTCEHGWIGSARVETEMQELNLSDLTSPAAIDPTIYGGILNGWVNAIGAFMNRETTPAYSLISIPGEGDYEFGRDDAFTAPPNEYFWVIVRSGELALFGREDYLLTAEDGPLLLSGDLWLKVKTGNANLSVQSMRSGIEAGNFRSGISRLHTFFCRFLEQLSKEDEEAEAERRKTSKEQENLAAAKAMGEFSSILNPKEYFPLRESQLLTSVSVVGRVLGVGIMPPSLSEDMTRVNDPIEAIARASKVRMRKVILGPEWWKRDSGPLVAYLGNDRKPVALLPGGGEYCMVDPDIRRRAPLTPEILEGISADAYTLYKPLQVKFRGMMDLLSFSIHGNVGDVVFILIMGVFSTLLGMLVPQVTGSLVDTAIPFADKGYVYQLALVLAAAGISGSIFTFAQVMATIRAGMHTEITAQSALWDRLLKFSPAFFRRFSSGDLETRVSAASEISRKLNIVLRDLKNKGNIAKL